MDVKIICCFLNLIHFDIIFKFCSCIENSLTVCLLLGLLPMLLDFIPPPPAPAHHNTVPFFQPLSQPPVNSQRV